MKGKISCKYYKTCGNYENCQRCEGYEKQGYTKYEAHEIITTKDKTGYDLIFIPKQAFNQQQ